MTCKNARSKSRQHWKHERTVCAESLVASGQHFLFRSTVGNQPALCLDEGNLDSVCVFCVFFDQFKKMWFQVCSKLSLFCLPFWVYFLSFFELAPHPWLSGAFCNLKNYDDGPVHMYFTLHMAIFIQNFLFSADTSLCLAKVILWSWIRDHSTLWQLHNEHVWYIKPIGRKVKMRILALHQINRKTWHFRRH